MSVLATETCVVVAAVESGGKYMWELAQVRVWAAPTVHTAGPETYLEVLETCLEVLETCLEMPPGEAEVGCDSWCGQRHLTAEMPGKYYYFALFYVFPIVLFLLI